MLTKIEDKRWEVVYENVYGRWSFRENLKKLDFFTIMGNHDHRGNQTAQLMYAQVGFKKGRLNTFRSHDLRTIIQKL